VIGLNQSIIHTFSTFLLCITVIVQDGSAVRLVGSALPPIFLVLLLPLLLLPLLLLRPLLLLGSCRPGPARLNENTTYSHPVTSAALGRGEAAGHHRRPKIEAQISTPDLQPSRAPHHQHSLDDHVRTARAVTPARVKVSLLGSISALARPPVPLLPDSTGSRQTSLTSFDHRLRPRLVPPAKRCLLLYPEFQSPGAPPSPLRLSLRVCWACFGRRTRHIGATPSVLGFRRPNGLKGSSFLPMTFSLIGACRIDSRLIVSPRVQARRGGRRRRGKVVLDHPAHPEPFCGRVRSYH